MKMQRWKDKNAIGIILLVIGSIGLTLGFSCGVVQLLTNPDISMIPKIIVSSALLFIAGISILKDDD